MGRWSHLDYPALTARQREYVLGAVLGDDGLVLCPVSRHACLRTSQSLAHREYLMWKFHVMRNHVFTSPRVTRNDRYGRVHRGIRFTTRTTPDLTGLYRLCYPEDRKTVSLEWLSQLTAFSLAVWYMDDGTYAPGRNFCMLYTGAFPDKQQRLIQHYLVERWGITGCVIQHNRRQWCLRFTRLGTQQLLALIEPYIKMEVPSMCYKLDYPKRGWTEPIQEHMNPWVYGWTSHEDAMLNREYGYVRAKFLAEHLGRSVNAVQLRAQKLGLDGWRGNQVRDGQGVYRCN